MLRCSLNKVRFSTWLQKPSYLHVSMQTEMLIRDTFRCSHLPPPRLHHQSKPNCTAIPHFKFPLFQFSSLNRNSGKQHLNAENYKDRPSVRQLFQIQPQFEVYYPRIPAWSLLSCAPGAAREHSTQLRGGLLSTDLEPTSILTPLTNFNGERLCFSFRAQKKMSPMKLQ